MGLGRVFGDIAMDLGLMRPASRKQESEADYIGLLMMAKSCYNPAEAVKVWERMEQVQRENEIPQWLSTHPSVSVSNTGHIYLCLLEVELAQNFGDGRMVAESRSSQG
jgi:hypothetical protein